MNPSLRLIFGAVLLGLAVNGHVGAAAPAWQTLDPVGRPHARHEAAFVQCDNKFFLLGGRRIQSVDIFDPLTQTWTEGKPPPVEVHHFQPVVWRHRIVLAGAMTGKYPHETALPRLLIYDPGMDLWVWGTEIPEARRRGGAGAVIADGKLYLVAGIINGHWDGNVTWLDALDLETGAWSQLPDAPHARDHFQAGLLEGRIYASGGRRTSGATKQVFDLTVPEVDVFDLASGTWSTLPDPLPTPRAGCFSLVVGRRYIVAGGESTTQPLAHAQVEAYDLDAAAWLALPSFVRGRHGSGLILDHDTLYTCAGSGARGGKPELDSMEALHPYP